MPLRRPRRRQRVGSRPGRRMESASTCYACPEVLPDHKLAIQHSSPPLRRRLGNAMRKRDLILAATAGVRLIQSGVRAPVFQVDTLRNGERQKFSLMEDAKLAFDEEVTASRFDRRVGPYVS
jgi:hypothetical protein